MAPPSERKDKGGLTAVTVDPEQASNKSDINTFHRPPVKLNRPDLMLASWLCCRASRPLCSCSEWFPGPPRTSCPPLAPQRQSTHLHLGPKYLGYKRQAQELKDGVSLSIEETVKTFQYLALYRRRLSLESEQRKRVTFKLNSLL